MRVNEYILIIIVSFCVFNGVTTTREELLDIRLLDSVSGQIISNYHYSNFHRVVADVARMSESGIIIRKDITFDEYYHKYIQIFETTYNDIIDDYLRGEEGVDYIQTVQELIRNNYEGDCDDFALFFYVIGRKLGIDIKYVHNINHAWIQVKKGEEWINYDSTRYRIGVNRSIIGYLY